MKIDVTNNVEFGEGDDECLSMTKCICGEKFPDWKGPVISIYEEDPAECPRCHRKFVFSNKIIVYEIINSEKE